MIYNFTHTFMKMYYTRTDNGAGGAFMFQCFLTYEEAVDNAKLMLSHCTIPHVDIVDMDTNNTFITFYPIRSCHDTEDARKNLNTISVCD